MPDLIQITYLPFRTNKIKHIKGLPLITIILKLLTKLKKLSNFFCLMPSNSLILISKKMNLNFGYRLIHMFQVLISNTNNQYFPKNKFHEFY